LLSVATGLLLGLFIEQKVAGTAREDEEEELFVSAWGGMCLSMSCCAAVMLHSRSFLRMPPVQEVRTRLLLLLPLRPANILIADSLLFPLPQIRVPMSKEERKRLKAHRREGLRWAAAAGWHGSGATAAVRSHCIPVSAVAFSQAQMPTKAKACSQPVRFRQ